MLDLSFMLVIFLVGVFCGCMVDVGKCSSCVLVVMNMSLILFGVFVVLMIVFLVFRLMILMLGCMGRVDGMMCLMVFCVVFIVIGMLLLNCMKLRICLFLVVMFR